MEKGVHHIRMHYTHSLTDISSFNCIVLKNSLFWCNLKGLSFLFLFIGIIQTILVAFSLKTSRACTDMLCFENDAIKVSKTAKNKTST